MMRRRKVYVVGNCQANAIADFYRDQVGGVQAEDVAYVDDLGLKPPELRARVADADLLIVQERDFSHGLTVEELGRYVEIHRFPMVLCGFLWPFADEPHVRNVAERPISDGPYPSQMGDSYLNRLISDGFAPEEALERYRALDVARVAHLDRKVEIYLDRQRRRDEATGIFVAGDIERRFRTESLFLTAEHPGGEIFALIAGQLLAKMGVPADRIGDALDSVYRSPFPPTELALHPRVAEHFGLSYAPPSRRYVLGDEGSFTFDEFVLRYMRYDNNPALRRAMFLAHAADPATTLAVLDEALPDSPRSFSGWRTRGGMLSRLDRHAEAAASYRRSLEIEPGDVDTVVEFARSRTQAGDLAQALPLAERAVALSPRSAFAQLALAEAHMAADDGEAALASAREAWRLLPGRENMTRALLCALNGSGRREEARAFVRDALSRSPGDVSYRNSLAELYEDAGQRIKAIATLEEGMAAGLVNDQSYSLLGNFHMRAGSLAEAEGVFARGAELYGERRIDLHQCLAQVRAMRAAA